MKVKVKTKEEIEEEFADCRDESNIAFNMPNKWLGLEGESFWLTKNMLKYCGMVIKLRDWDGWLGFYDGYCWTLPMLNIMNRNGANE